MSQTARLRHFSAAATALVLVAGLSACSPGAPAKPSATPTSAEPSAADAAPEFSSSPQRSTSVAPVTLAEAQRHGSGGAYVPDVCRLVGLSTAQIAKLTSLPLPNTPPVAPGNRPEMCAYGGMWADPPGMFDRLERAANGENPDPQDQAETADAEATTPTETTADAAGTETTVAKSDTAANAANKPSHNSVFISALALTGRGPDPLASIPRNFGEEYSCSLTTRTITVPKLAEISTTPVTLPSAPTAKPRKDGGFRPAAPTPVVPYPPANLRGGTPFELNAVECENTPPGSAPQIQVFFIANKLIWQVSSIAPNLDGKAPKPEAQLDGLRRLSAMIAAG